MTNYRFLVIPALQSTYDYRMVKGLSDSFGELGYYSTALTFHCSDAHIDELCKALGINVVIGINRTFEYRAKNNSIRYISWFQDVFTNNFNLNERLLDGDILYTLGTAELLGLSFDKERVRHSTLFTGVDQRLVQNTYTFNIKNKIDFSLAGFIPSPVYESWELKKDLIWLIENYISSIPLLPRIKIIWLIKQLVFRNFYGVDYIPTSVVLSMKKIVESIYQPLTGSLDIHKLSEAMESVLVEYRRPKYSARKTKRKNVSEISSVLSPYYDRYIGRSDFSASLIKYLIKKNDQLDIAEYDAIKKAIAYFSNTYPRFLDRAYLIDGVIDISKSLQLYGKGWDTHPKYSPYYYGSLEDHDDLLNLYRRTKINLSNNTHGLGMHSRNLECMAVGGFLMMHTSPNENSEGGMSHHFLPGIHYASYTHENFKDEAKYWLKNESKRNEIGLNSRDEIIRNHLWIHRARKIIKDLDC